MKIIVESCTVARSQQAGQNIAITLDVALHPRQLCMGWLLDFQDALKTMR